jgi:cytochrome c oxidase subunit 3
VLGQTGEYHNLVNEGLTLSATGYELGLHHHRLPACVIGGLIAFIFVLARSTMGRFTPAQATATSSRTTGTSSTSSGSACSPRSCLIQ